VARVRARARKNAVILSVHQRLAEQSFFGDERG